MTIMHVLLSIIIVALLFEKTSVGSKQCSFIKNASVSVDSDSIAGPSVPTSTISVTGCLQPETFIVEPVESIAINCTGSEITELEEGAIENLSNLKRIQISNCPIQYVRVKPFKNVKNIFKIALNNGRFKGIGKKVFRDVRSLKILDLQNNEIDFIEDEAFGDLSDLTVLFLSHNNLTFWRREWFRDHLSLFSIEFGHNVLLRVPERAFVEFPKLQVLNFSYNKISLIDANAFEDVRNLKLLDLSHNRLKAVPPTMLDATIGKELKLYLELNFLNYLPELFLQKMVSNIKSLSIRGNPFKCPCLNLIYEAINNRNLNLSIFNQISLVGNKECGRPDIPQCVFSKHQSNKCTETVEDELTNIFINHLRTFSPILADVCYNADVE